MADHLVRIVDEYISCRVMDVGALDFETARRCFAFHTRVECADGLPCVLVHLHQFVDPHTCSDRDHSQVFQHVLQFGHCLRMYIGADRRHFPLQISVAAREQLDGLIFCIDAIRTDECFPILQESVPAHILQVIGEPGTVDFWGTSSCDGRCLRCIVYRQVSHEQRGCHI